MNCFTLSHCPFCGKPFERQDIIEFQLHMSNTLCDEEDHQFWVSQLGNCFNSNWSWHILHKQTNTYIDSRIIGDNDNNERDVHFNHYMTYDEGAKYLKTYLKLKAFI